MFETIKTEIQYLRAHIMIPYNERTRRKVDIYVWEQSYEGMFECIYFSILIHKGDKLSLYIDIHNSIG